MFKNIVFAAIVLSSCGQPIKGEQGPPGPVGMQGPAGAPGTTGARGATGDPGNDLAIADKKSCYVYSGGAAFHYYSALFDNGMRYVSCGINSSLDSYQSTNLYSANQVGNSTGGCSLVYDIDTPSAGFWTFQLTPEQAQYHDIGSGNDGTIVSFGPTGCTNLGQ